MGFDRKRHPGNSDAINLRKSTTNQARFFNVPICSATMAEKQMPKPARRSGLRADGKRGDRGPNEEKKQRRFITNSATL